MAAPSWSSHSGCNRGHDSVVAASARGSCDEYRRLEHGECLPMISIQSSNWIRT